MPKSLADGYIKFTILTEEPNDPAKPTAAELNAGVQMECNILASDFTWTAGDSDKVAEKALCDTSNANALGSSNFTGAFTVFRKFDAATGAVDEEEDEAFQVAKVKGTTLWGYARQNGKAATAPWATGDEIWLGLEILTDTPQTVTGGGYIKARIPTEPQRGWPFTEVDAA